MQSNPKESVVVVYTGNGKGKTGAGLGLMVRVLGNGGNVAFIQFINYSDAGEQAFMRSIQSVYGDRLHFYKGGNGLVDAGAQNITREQHIQAAQEAFAEALSAVNSGNFNLVVCDEINSAVHNGLLSPEDIKKLLASRNKQTSLCLTGRDFPQDLFMYADAATGMTELKNHSDGRFSARLGIDY